MFEWKDLLSAVLAVIPAISEARRDRAEHAERTLEVLHSAYYATERYFESRRVGSARSIEREVAYEWDRLSDLMRRYDANLASRLSLKGRFWREGASWSDRQIQDSGIVLSEIRREVRISCLVSNKKISRVGCLF